jgi:cytochrome c-type protein NapB
MKNKLRKTIILSIATLGIGLSAYTGIAFADAHQKEEAPATAPDAISADTITKEVTAEISAEMTTPSAPVAPTAPKADTSGVTSSTPKMTNFEFKGVRSLRTEATLQDSDAGQIKLMPADRPPIARNYFQQPPLVPHRVREYKITVRNNKCMSCHSWKNYKQARATKVSQTHFADRDGNAGSTLAARRYFCNQCHVPQIDAKPLVENSFAPVNQLNK